MTATCKLGEKGCWNDGKCRATSKCENKVFTNADRIRAMSDEELAKILVDGFCCNLCKYKDTNRWDCPEECEKCCAEWLKQPTE